MEKNNCNKCLHFYVTYKRDFPYGCRAFGMISKNYPYSDIHQGEFNKSFDNKIRYPKALRQKMLSFITNELISKGADPTIIYHCME